MSVVTQQSASWQAKFNQWKTSYESGQSTKTQVESVQKHSDSTAHINSVPHSDATSHTDNQTHTNNSPHTNSVTNPQHVDYTALSAVDVTSNTYTYYYPHANAYYSFVYQAYTYSGSAWNYSYSSTITDIGNYSVYNNTYYGAGSGAGTSYGYDSHTNYAAFGYSITTYNINYTSNHTDYYQGTHSNVAPHTNSTVHSDTYPHTDALQTHTDSTSHTDTNTPTHVDTVSSTASSYYSLYPSGYVSGPTTLYSTNIMYDSINYSQFVAYGSVIAYYTIVGYYPNTTTGKSGAINVFGNYLKSYFAANPAGTFHYDSSYSHVASSNYSVYHVDYSVYKKTTSKAYSDSHANFMVANKLTYTQYPHTDNYSGNTHTDAGTGHIDSNSNHNNYSTHNDYGFNHDNFIPSTPQVFNVSDPTDITSSTAIEASGTLAIAVDAYDEDGDAARTKNYQLTISGTLHFSSIEYKIELYNPNTSTWTTLQDYNTNSSINLDTTSYADGQGYRLKVSVRNPSYTSGGMSADYYGPSNIAVFTINNAAAVSSNKPQIQVTDAYDATGSNQNCFIDFTFNSLGATSNTGIYKTYTEGLFSNANPSPSSEEQKGLFVTVKMRDIDDARTTQQNWQKASIILMGSSSSSEQVEVPVIWADTGTQITSAGLDSSLNPVDRLGHAYIPYVVMYSVFGYQTDIKVFTKVQDFTDSACTVSANAATIVNNVSTYTPQTSDDYTNFYRTMQINLAAMSFVNGLSVTAVKSTSWDANTILPKQIKISTDATTNEPTIPDTDESTDYVRYSTGSSSGNPIKMGYAVESGIRASDSNVTGVYAEVHYEYCPSASDLTTSTDVTSTYGYDNNGSYAPLSELFSSVSGGSGDILYYAKYNIVTDSDTGESVSYWAANQYNPPVLYNSNLDTKVTKGLLKVKYKLYVKTKTTGTYDYYATRTMYIIDLSSNVLSDIGAENR